MDRRGLDDWLDAFKQAWETQNADKIVPLFTADCEYRCTPFTEPVLGKDLRTFWQALAREQQDNHFDYEILGETFANRAVVHWNSSSTKRGTTQRHETNGIFLLTFERDGLCSDLREWWHLHPVGAPLEKRWFIEGNH
jgi:hypothetical protein